MAETTEFGPRKTIFILAIVAGCFAVLWPKVFYPMLTSTVTPRHPTSDGSTCCDVIFESDVNVADILQEMCRNILKHHQINPRVRDVLSTSRLSPQGASLCREQVLDRCGIDLSTFLAENQKLGKTYKQVLEEIRSFNGSLCLKNNFGVPLSQLGTPHLIRYHISMPHSPIRQERRTPSHAGGLHPALRERGRAIPSSHIVPKIKDRPDHVSMPMKTRPTIGGAGHVVPPKGGTGMGLIMPLYTLGIVLFFLYTISKVLRKNSDNEIHSEYVGEAAEREFQRMVFSPETFLAAFSGGSAEKQPKSGDDSRIPTLEELQELEGDKKTKRGVTGVGSHFKAELPNECCCEKETEELLPSVKVLGMETTASSEDCQKCSSRPTTPIPTLHSPEREKTPPKTIYLEGELPRQCELLVTDSETRTEKLLDEELLDDHEEAPIVLAGKMTLSLISLEQDTNCNESVSNLVNIKDDDCIDKLNDDDEDSDNYKDSSEDISDECITERRVPTIYSNNDDKLINKRFYVDTVDDNLWLDETEIEDKIYSENEQFEE